MNLFYLSENFDESARFHVDRHVIKIILEAAQCLATARNELGWESPYKSAQKNNPVCKWVRASSANYIWTIEYALALCREYSYRYDKIHACQSKISSMIPINDNKFPLQTKTDFYLAMPDQYKVAGDPVQSYRNYYNGDKRHLFSWKLRQQPDWIT